MMNDNKDLNLSFPDGGTVFLSRDDWEHFMNAIENPKSATESLKKLMRQEPLWSNPATK